MKTIFEEFKKDNDFIEIYDDDGMIVIQMSSNSVKKIINEFDSNIKNKINHNSIVDVVEFDESFKLDLSLTVGDNDFKLTGSKLNSNFYRNFELECCTYEDWENIKDLVNK